MIVKLVETPPPYDHALLPWIIMMGQDDQHKTEDVLWKLLVLIAFLTIPLPNYLHTS